MINHIGRNGWFVTRLTMAIHKGIVSNNSGYTNYNGWFGGTPMNWETTTLGICTRRMVFKCSFGRSTIHNLFSFENIRWETGKRTHFRFSPPLRCPTTKHRSRNGYAAFWRGRGFSAKLRSSVWRHRLLNFFSTRHLVYIFHDCMWNDLFMAHWI